MAASVIVRATVIYYHVHIYISEQQLQQVAKNCTWLEAVNINKILSRELTAQLTAEAATPSLLRRVNIDQNQSLKRMLVDI